MKAEELQIFDWVSYKGNPIMVFEIDEPEHNINTEQDGYNAIRCISIDEIQPIPITPKGLEKNGFVLKPDGWLWCKDEGNESHDYIFIQFRRGCEEVRICDVDFFGLYGLDHATFRNIQYVHQLQQLLRIFGVNKEIEL